MATVKRPTVNKESYFQTQIYFFDFPDATNFNASVKRQIRKWRNEQPEGIVRSNVEKTGAWHSTVDMNTKPQFGNFCQRVIDIATNVFTDLDYENGSVPLIDNMWANINPPQGYNRQHNHPNCLWSGVYYVQAPKDCGRLYFVDPRKQATMLQPRLNKDSQIKRELWQDVYYQPIEGRIVLFPAWLEHAVEPNLSKRKGTAAERISISFNLRQSA